MADTFDDLFSEYSLDKGNDLDKKPANGGISSLDDLLAEYGKPKEKAGFWSSLASSVLAASENAGRGIMQGIAGSLELPSVIPKSWREAGEEALFSNSEKLRQDEELLRKTQADKEQTLWTKGANVLGNVLPVIGTGGASIAGSAGALGQDVLANGGDVTSAQEATGISGALNAAMLPLGALGKTRVQSGLIQALVNPVAGGVQQAALNQVTPEKMHQDPLNVEARLTDALVGAATGYVAGGKPQVKPRVEPKAEPGVIPTGDPDIDLGQAMAAKRPSVEDVAKKRDEYQAPAQEETKDLFGNTEALGMDMFSGKPVDASTIEARRQAALNPERTVDSLAELEKEYLLNQQDRVNQPKAEVIAKQGDVPDPYLNISNQDLPPQQARKVFTREGQEVGVQDYSPNTAMQRAMLEGLAERGQLRNEPTPVEKPAPVQQEIFQPSRNPSVEQEAFQRQLELPNQVEQPSLFADTIPKKTTVEEPIKNEAKPETKKETSFVDEIARANTESIQKTGKPLTNDKLNEIRAKFNKEQPAFSADEHELAKGQLERQGTEAFDTEGHTLPEELHSSPADVKEEIKKSFGVDAKHVEKAIDNGKIKIISSNELPSHVQKMVQDIPGFRPRGWFSKDGTATLVSDFIRKGSVRELIYHEVGGHGGLQQLANKGKYVDRILALAKSGNKQAKTAISMAALQKKALNLPTENAQHEMLAYFLQHMSNEVQSPKGAVGRAFSVYNEIKAQLKDYLNDKFGWKITELSDKDIYHLASGALKRFADKESVAQKTPAFAAQEAKTEEGTTQKPAPRPTNLGKLLKNSFTAYGVTPEVGRIILDSSELSGMAQRLVQLNQRGFKTLEKADQAVVNRALDGDKSAFTQLNDKQQAAIKSFRDDVQDLQLRLAAENPKLDGENLAPMLYESVAKGDYNTIAYGAYVRKPDLWYNMRRNLFGTTTEPYWIDHLQKKNPEVLQNFSDFVSKNIAIPEVTKLTDSEVKDLSAWWNVDGTNVEDLRKQLTEKRNAYGMDLETQTKQILRDFVENRDNSSVKVVKQAARNPGILKERVNMPKEMKAFLGEERDPTLRMAYTLSRLGDLLSKQNALGRMAALGEGKYFFKDKASPEGYNVKIPENDDYGPLAGMYTSKAVLDQIKTLTSLKVDDTASAVTDLAKHSLNATGRVTGTAKLAATVGSHTTGLVNLYSNLVGMSRNVMINSLMGNAKDAAVNPFKSLIETGADSFNLLSKDKLKRYAELGLTGDSANFGELRDVTRNTRYREAMQESGPVGKVVRGSAHQVGNVVQVAAKIYSIPDVALRLDTYLAHVSALKKVFPEKSLPEIERLAADKAKDEVPTFARATPIVKNVSKAMGNFATWASEVVRTTANQGINALKDIEEGYKTGNKQQVRYGVAQLAGTAAYVSASRVLVPALVATIFDLAKKNYTEKDKENLSELAPDFYKGNDLQLIETDPKTHHALFVNSSRIDPANPYNEAYNRIMNGVNKDGALKEIWPFIHDNFLNWGPMPQALYQAYQNENSFGQPLPQEEKYGPVMVPGRASPIINALTPGTIKNLAQANKIEKRAQNPIVATAKLAGAPLYELEADKQLKNRMYDFTKEQRTQNESFKKSFGAIDNKYTDEDLRSIYKDYVTDDKELFTKTRRAVQAANETFGMKNSQIYELMGDASVGKDSQFSLVNGKYKPRDWMSDDFLDKSMKKAIEADKTNEVEIRKDFLHRKQLLHQLRRESL